MQTALGRVASAAGLLGAEASSVGRNVGGAVWGLWGNGSRETIFLFAPGEEAEEPPPPAGETPAAGSGSSGGGFCPCCGSGDPEGPAVAGREVKSGGKNNKDGPETSAAGGTETTTPQAPAKPIEKKDGIVDITEPLPPVGTIRRDPNGRAVKLKAADDLVSTATDGGAHADRMFKATGDNLVAAPRDIKNTMTGGVDETQPAPLAGTVVRDTKTGRLYKWEECPMADVTGGTADSQDKAKVATEAGKVVVTAAVLHGVRRA